jgi:hypothetical protein
VSTHNVTPVGTLSGPVTKALLAPLVVSLSAFPEPQSSRAAWIRDVSREVSLGTPPDATVWDADSVAQAGGIVGSAGKFVSPAPQPVVGPASVAPLSAPPALDPESEFDPESTPDTGLDPDSALDPESDPDPDSGLDPDSELGLPVPDSGPVEAPHPTATDAMPTSASVDRRILTRASPIAVDG